MIKEIRDIGWHDIKDKTFSLIDYDFKVTGFSFEHKYKIHSDIIYCELIAYRPYISEVRGIVLMISKNIEHKIGWEWDNVNKVSVLRGLGVC